MLYVHKRKDLIREGKETGRNMKLIVIIFKKLSIVFCCHWLIKSFIHQRLYSPLLGPGRFLSLVILYTIACVV
jgi:hypothetical protein